MSLSVGHHNEIPEGPRRPGVGHCGRAKRLFLLLVLLGLVLRPGSASAVISLLDDFSDTALNQYGLSGRMADGDGNIIFAFVSTTTTARPFGHLDYSLEIQYDVSTLNDEAWFFTPLSSSGDADLSAFNYLSFWVRGAAGGEGFSIGFEDSTYANSYMQVNEYLPAGITTQWQKVVIPFSVLESGTSILRSQVSKVVVKIINTALYGSAIGTVYLDDICFGMATAPIWIESYNDGAYPNACKGNTGLDGTAVDMSVSYHSLTYTSSPYSFEVDYSLATSVGNLVHNTNTIDISHCTHLQFDILGANGNEDPDIRLQDPFWIAGSVPVTDYVTVSNTGFQTVSIPIVDFVLAGLPGTTIVAECDFDFDASASSPSFVYLDNLHFVDQSVPSMPTDMTLNGVALTADDMLIIALSGVVGVTADALTTDPKLEGVKFEYWSEPLQDWVTIAVDYATADAKTSFQTSAWDLSGLYGGSVQIRATSLHVGGNTSTALTRRINFLQPTPTPIIPNVVDVRLGLNSLNPDQGQVLPIEFYIPDRGQVRAVIYSRQGRKIKELVNGQIGPGIVPMTWDGKDGAGHTAGSGVYLLFVEAPGKNIKRLFAVIR